MPHVEGGMICGREFDSRRLHQQLKANHSRLDFFLAVYCGLAGASGFLRTSGIGLPSPSGRVSLSPGGTSLLVGRAPARGVRKQSRTQPDKTVAYACTNQAVG